MDKNNYLAKWLNKEIDDKTLENYASEEEIRAYKRIISATSNLKNEDYNAELEFEKLKQKRASGETKKSLFNNYFLRIAAVIAIIFGVYYFSSNTKTHHKTNYAEKSTFLLPDSSEVHLNAASNISYTSKNWNDNRILNLTGEAFFKVKKGATFSVKTTNGTVQVLGTQFNVVQRENYFKVTCFEGLVSVTFNNKTLKLPAGNSFKFVNGEVQKNKGITSTKPHWMLNSSYFESMPYYFVIAEFERQYDINIEVNAKFNNELFTGSFPHNNLNLALQAISVPLNLNFKQINKNTIRLDSNSK